MTFKVADNVRETTTSEGTGSIALGGVPSPDFQTVLSGIGNGNSSCFGMRSGSDLEVFFGTLTSGTTLSRDSVIYSTNGNAKVNWGPGDKDLYCTTSASLLVMLSAVLAGAGDANKVVKANASGTGFDMAAQGPGGGLNADQLDGREAAEFALLTGANFSGVVNTAKGAAVTSAATINLDTATGNVIDLSGSTGPITTVTLSAGRVRFVRCLGTPTFTNGASLDLGGANIVADAGTLLMFYGDASGVTRLIAGRKANGRPFRQFDTGASGHSNLRVAPNASTPLSKVTFTADSLTLIDSSGLPRVVSNVNVTVDVTVTGLNGRDAGSETSSTWFFLYAVSDGSTAGGILSTSATAPTLPGAYTFKKLIGAVRNDVSSNFIDFLQVGDLWQYVTPVNLFNGVMGTWSATAPIWAAASVTSLVPTARARSALVITAANWGGSGGSGSTYVAPNSGYAGQRSSNPPPIISGYTNGDSSYGELLLENTYLAVAGQNSASGANISGFRLNL